ncbi:hypothetical protein [Helicobacter sp. 23-1045]
MTKSSVVSINESLEQIEELTADIRLSLMQRDIEMVCNDYLCEVQRVDDCIAIHFEAHSKYHFGILVGYFDECWWSGIVLFKADDSTASTSDKLQSASNDLHQKGFKISLSSEHYVYMDSVGVIECEEFSEFMPKVLESINANKDLLYKINVSLENSI